MNALDEMKTMHSRDWTEPSKNNGRDANSPPEDGMHPWRREKTIPTRVGGRSVVDIIDLGVLAKSGHQGGGIRKSEVAPERRLMDDRSQAEGETIIDTQRAESMACATPRTAMKPESRKVCGYL